jgi:hypothetical protein
MACEKHSNWMTDGVLGELSDAQAEELRVHVSRCSPCLAEWQSAQVLAAAVDRSLAAMVAGEPSPQFAARLRARIAEEPAPAAFGLLTWPRSSIAAAVAATALFAVLTVRSPQRLVETANRSSAPVIVEPARIAEAQSATEPARAGRTAAPLHKSPDAGRASAIIQAEVLVPPGQLSAALLLSEAVMDGRVNGSQLSALAESASKPLEVKAIEIAPLKAPTAADSADDGAPSAPARD